MMRLKTVQELLNFDGALPEALFVESRSDLIDEAAKLVAWRRAQNLLELVKAEIKPARERASEVKAEAEAAKVEWEKLLGQLRDAPKGEKDELRQRYNEAEFNATKLDTRAKLAANKARQLPWLLESLKTIERPDLDSLEIILNEVKR